MSRKAPRVPPTFTIATAGRPARRLTEAALAMFAAGLVERGSLSVLNTYHDGGCRCLSGASMTACTCEVVELRLDPIHRSNRKDAA
jgi:hypothetical protein